MSATNRLHARDPQSTLPTLPTMPTIGMSTLLALFGVVAAIGATTACRRAPAATSTASDDPIVHVTTAVAIERPMPVFLALTGSLVANEAADVAADTTGKILVTTVERGSLVEKGAVLARTDARTASLVAAEASASAESANTQHELAKSDCARVEKLFAAGAITGAEHDRQSSQCNIARLSAQAASVRVQSAQKGLGDTSVRAPFAGMIAERYVSAGEYLRPDSKVVRLVAVDPLRLDIAVPEASVQAIRQGLPVEFRVAAFPDTTFKGSIRYVGPALRASSRDLVVEATVPNPDKKLLPGMFATAKVQLSEKPAVVVPEKAVRRDGEVSRIFVVVGGRAEERLAQLGERRDDVVAVEHGLKVGEQVVSPVTPDLRDGARVQ